MIAAFLGALFFAVAGYLGSLLAAIFVDRLQPLPDGPPQQKAPVPLLIAGCAAIGAILTTHSGSQGQILIVAIVCTSLVAIWITDARRGIVPDAFTLGPLTLLILVALWQHEWRVFVAAAIPFVPFAITATISKGRGMGWGDVKLVALGGIVLGPQVAVTAFALACFAAVVVSYRGGRKKGAIAFAPYLACAIGLGIPFEVLH
jgi:leader peptidase (prepilin peptidase) / N-methyltransferase